MAEHTRQPKQETDGERRKALPEPVPARRPARLPATLHDRLRTAAGRQER